MFKRVPGLFIATLFASYTAIAQQDSVATESEPSFAPVQQLDEEIAGTYVGTLGEKSFTLQINQAWDGKLSGWNQTGTNKRPVRGTYTQGVDAKGEMQYIFKMREPGTDKWDGEFTLYLRRFRVGTSPTFLSGSWKSFNGQLRKTVKGEKEIQY